MALLTSTIPAIAWGRAGLMEANIDDLWGFSVCEATGPPTTDEAALHPLSAYIILYDNLYMYCAVS